MSSEAQQERLQLLRGFLGGQDVPESYYSIGKYRDEAVCIEAENDGWVVYEGDRGGRYNEKHFEDFYEAGRYLLSRATYNQDHRAYLLSSFERYWKKCGKKQPSDISKQKSSILQSRLLMPAILISVSVIVCLVIAAALFQIYLASQFREEGLQLYLASNYSVLIIVLGIIIIILGVHHFTGSSKSAADPSVGDPLIFTEPFLGDGEGYYDASASHEENEKERIPIFIIIVIIVIIIASILFFLHPMREPSRPPLDQTISPSPLPSITAQK